MIVDSICRSQIINKSVLIFLPHLSLFLLGTAAGLLILVHLLAQGGDLVSQMFQFILNLLHTLHPGLALQPRCLTDARGISEGRKAQRRQHRIKTNLNATQRTSESQVVPPLEIIYPWGQLDPVILQVPQVSLASVDSDLAHTHNWRIESRISYTSTVRNVGFSRQHNHLCGMY